MPASQGARTFLYAAEETVVFAMVGSALAAPGLESHS